MRVLYTPSTPIRFTDPWGYDNSEDVSIPPELQYALDALWDFATWAVDLPLPSPWGLILKDTPAITIERDSDLMGGWFHYNYDPELMGADYLWHLDTPVNTGWYLIDDYAKAEAGVLMCSWWWGPYGSIENGVERDKIDARKAPEIVLPGTKTKYTKVGRTRNEYRSEVTHKPITKLKHQLSTKPGIEPLYCSFVKEADVNISGFGLIFKYTHDSTRETTHSLLFYNT